MTSKNFMDMLLNCDTLQDLKEGKSLYPDAKTQSKTSFSVVKATTLIRQPQDHVITVLCICNFTQKY